MLTPWQKPHFTRAIDLFERKQLGHAQLVVGPPSLGKLDLARALGRRLLCTNAHGAVEACGTCKSCSLLAAGSHPDWHEITFEERDDGKLRTEITIDQLRKLSGKLQLSSQLGGPVFAMIHPADSMNFAASNTLLKTLEEPMENRFLFLVASQIGRISATIKSRCQRLEVRIPPLGESLSWLMSQGIDATTAQEALRAARGNPGLAMAWIADGDVLPLRASVLSQLDAIAAGRATLREVSDTWVDHEELPMILEFAADHALTTASAHPSAALALGEWFDKVNQTRGFLTTTLRKDLMLHELLLQWQSVSRKLVA